MPGRGLAPSSISGRIPPRPSPSRDDAGRTIFTVDPLAARAADDYHRLLRDDEALVAELEERFFERIKQARLLFGGRVLCAFPRPNFVAPSDYEAIRTVCRRSSMCGSTSWPPISRRMQQ